MLTVLVHEYLSGGGALDGASAVEAAELLAQGRAMRDAMAQDLRALSQVEVVFAAHDELTQRAMQADAVWTVAPETAGVLAALCESVLPAKWLGCSSQAIRIAGSKRATRERLAAASLPVPDVTDGVGRCVVKPDDGAGATDTLRLDSFAAASAQARPGMTIERWIDGDPMSLSLLCSRGRAELLSINRQRIDVDADGRVTYRGVDIAIEPIAGERGRRLQRLASQVAAALPGLFGLVGIDLVWHPQRGPVVIEVNPRVTSAYVGLSARLGRNVAADLLARWRDG